MRLKVTLENLPSDKEIQASPDRVWNDPKYPMVYNLADHHLSETVCDFVQGIGPDGMITVMARSPYTYLNVGGFVVPDDDDPIHEQCRIRANELYRKQFDLTVDTLQGITDEQKADLKEQVRQATMDPDFKWLKWTTPTMPWGTRC